MTAPQRRRRTIAGLLLSLLALAVATALVLLLPAAAP